MIYLIEGSETTRDEAEQYFINYSGYDKQDAIFIFRNEDSDYIMNECPEIEILEGV